MSELEPTRNQPSIRHGGRAGTPTDGKEKPGTRKHKYFNIKADVKLQERWNGLKVNGLFKINTSFLSYLLHLEDRISSASRSVYMYV